MSGDGTTAIGQKDDALATNSTGAWSVVALLKGLLAAAAVSAGGYLYKRLNTVATTNVKAGAGLLHSVTINAKGTVASTITLYDALTATGTVIAVIDSLNNAGTFSFDVAFTVGLTAVVTGTIAPDLTISYR